MRNKLIAAGAGLIGYGALVGWAVTADFYERRMTSNQKLLGDIINRQARELESSKDLLLTIEMGRPKELAEYDEPQVEAMREQGQSLLDTMRRDGEREVVEDDHNTDAEEEDEPYSEEKTEELRTNLQGLIDTYTADPDEVNEFNELTAKAIEIDERPPFVISRQKYSWDEEEGDDYAKITLTYYPRDRILLDDEQDVIEDVAGYVGWRSLSQFGSESDDGDVVYVRNPRLETDFEVVRDMENQPPAHVRFGMGRDEYETNKAAGLIRFGREGRDRS
jgi:hypothetical protein